MSVAAKSQRLKVRLARSEDVPTLGRIETDSYGRKMTEDAVAAEELLLRRIGLLNQKERGWFFVAEAVGFGDVATEIVGSVIMMPTSINVDTCPSWEAATNGGKLEGVFDPGGETVYVVSFGVPSFAPELTAEHLVCRVVFEWARSKQSRLALCSGIPGYSRWYKKTKLGPEAYWHLSHADRKGPKDPMLRYYSDVIGAKPYRLLPNGYPPDKLSLGHAVLCIAEDPAHGLHCALEQLSMAAFGSGYRSYKQASPKPSEEAL
jgi:hypothetical protein